MPFFLTAAGFSAISSLLIRFFIGSLILRIFTSLGIVYITFEATEYVGNQIRGYINSAVYSLPSQFVEVFGSLGGFQCINIVFSAFIAALTIKSILKTANHFAFGGSA